jgi:predicted nucleic acid-binding protein
LILDTGILFALADRDDSHHRAAAAVLALPDPKTVPEPVVVETDWMILRYLGVEAEIAFLRSLDEDSFAIEAPNTSDRRRALELVETYRDAHLGYVDAATIAIAERLRETRIATVDRRDFSLVRPRHVEAFELLPQRPTDPSAR